MGFRHFNVFSPRNVKFIVFWCGTVRAFTLNTFKKIVTLQYELPTVFAEAKIPCHFLHRIRIEIRGILIFRQRDRKDLKNKVNLEK